MGLTAEGGDGRVDGLDEYAFAVYLRGGHVRVSRAHESGYSQ